MTISYVAGSAGIMMYVITTLLALKNKGNRLDTQPPGKQSRLMTCAWIASFFHASSILNIFQKNEGINFSFFSTAALVILIVVLILNIASLSKPVEKLGLLIFPMAALTLLLHMLIPDQQHLLKNLSAGMEFHILVSIIAYSLLNIAAVQAILLALQDYQLRHREPNRFIRSFPPLQTMEALLFQMISIGLALLTISLISGFIFVTDLFGQHLAHKTVLSILAWIVFAVLLWGRMRHGWRGKTAIRWTLAGFASLMLAYFGSKMVLELILNRG